MDLPSQLPDLQLEQQKHDEVAHRDILALAAQDRVKHMVLHFAKYSGHFADIHESCDDARFVATLVDTFIICLACANTLNFKLKDLTNDTARAFGTSGTLKSNDLVAPFSRQFAKITGTMAKACESLDHFERFDYHGTLERGLAGIALLCMDAAKKSNIDLVGLTRQRWDRVERRFRSAPVSKNESIRLAASKT